MIRVILEAKKFGDYSTCFSDKAQINKILYLNKICSILVDVKETDVLI